MSDNVMPIRSEKQKMLAGELYDPCDAELAAERRRARALCHELNALDPEAVARRHELLVALLGAHADASIHAPFFCDYGYNIFLGANVYFNVNCVVLDVLPVTVGANVLFGPGVQLYTASHPLSATERRTGLEFGRPISVGDDTWIGGGVVVCPGVTIGSGCVIGAGSVVTRNVPDGVFAAGNPCRVVRRL
jgi:maltose O-acetyltransferase